MKTKTIFLASSNELKEDRIQFEIFVGRKNQEWIEKGIFLELVVWENFIDAMSRTRLQNEYNKAIQESDIFICLFFTKVGEFTAEEFSVAFENFKIENRPFIFTYFKEPENNYKKERSINDFQKKLNELGHFYTRYKNIEGLLYHFNSQLEKLYKSEFKSLSKEKGNMVQIADKIFNIEHIENATFN